MNDLLLLHAALGGADQFDALADDLHDEYVVHTLDFEGHGGASATDRPFRIETFAQNVVDYLDAHGIRTVDVFGYSMGGYVALYLASTLPDRIGRIMTFGTKLRWDPETSSREVRMLDAAKIREKVPHFAATLEARHSGAGWESVLSKTAEMMMAMGAASPLADERFRSIAHTVRLGVGDRDSTVGVDETLGVYRLLQRGELQVFPATPHAFDKVRIPMMSEAIREFFADIP